MSEQLPIALASHPEDNHQSPEPFTNQPEENKQLPDPFTNQPVYNGQELFQNPQVYNGQLEEPLTNTPKDQQRNLNVRRRQPIKKRYCLYVCAIIILCIEIFMNFCYYLSDSFSNGMFYRPDKEVEKRLDKMEAFFRNHCIRSQNLFR